MVVRKGSKGEQALNRSQSDLLILRQQIQSMESEKREQQEIHQRTVQCTPMTWLHSLLVCHVQWISRCAKREYRWKARKRRMLMEIDVDVRCFRGNNGQHGAS